ncbi:MBL fold metallo-hydrolase [Chloroflexota bacterium]
MKEGEEVQQITTNVYVDTQFSKRVSPGCNYSFVVTSEGIVMIDTPMLPTYAIRWRDEIAEKGEVRYVINTEHHPDHISGNYFFSGTVVSHQGVREMLSAPIEKVIAPEMIKAAVAASMDLREYILWRYQLADPEGLALAQNYQLRPPTITFTEQLTVYSGDHTFELIHLPGHTPYQVGVYVPQERVIFTGDNFINEWQSSLAYCCPLEWIESLKKIEAMDVDFIVPGHGEVGDKMALREFAEFIQGVIDIIRRAIDQGITKEEAVKSISFEELRPARHPGVEQQQMNITRLYEMLSK